MQLFAPQWLFFLWLVPAVAGIYWLSNILWKKRMSALVPERTLLTRLIAGYRSSEQFVRPLLMALVVFLSVLALARPQWGDEKRQVQRKGVDLVFLVDTSLSMLAEDVKPNRLEKAKYEIEAFLKEFHGDRIGMVTFAGSGFLQTPLTLDYSAFRLFLEALQVGILPDPGTSLSQAIRLAIQAFPQKELKYKALIVLGDGEDHEGGIETAIEAAKKAGVRIYTIGLGTAEGEPIPLKNEKGERSGFKKDRSGQMVITKLNEPLLQKIARDTDGLYLPATPSEKEVDIIVKHLKGWGEQKFSEKEIVEKDDQYQVFLFIALLLLIAEMFIKRRDRRTSALLGCVLAFFLFSGFLGSSSSAVKKGNEQYQQKKYQSALENYRKVQVRKPDDPEVLYNLGTALYKTDQFKESSQDLDSAVKKMKDPQLKAKALYNYGNTQYRLGNFEKAIDSYKKALEIDPNDKDSKYNLEFIQNQKKKIDKKDQERKQQNKDQQNKEQPQQNQQQDKQQQDKQQQQDQQQQQNQQSQGGQGQQDKQQQQNQDQQNKDQQNKDQQNKDQQQQQNQQSQGGQGQQDKQQQQKPQDQQNQQQPKPDQGDQGKQGEQDKQDQQQQEQQQKQEQQQQKPQDQQQKEQEQKQEQQDQEGQKPDEKPAEQRQGRSQRPLQGQMSMDNALTILDALKDSEKELQDLRRPPVDRNPPQVEKDW